MKNIMIILGTFLFGTASCASNSAMEIFKSFDEYQITKVEESRVCWATLSATSSNGVPSFFATYKRKDGDRWQVTGYSGKEAKNADDILTAKAPPHQGLETSDWRERTQRSHHQQ